MTITVRFFASLRERIGSDVIALEVCGRTGADEVLEVLRRRLGAKLAAELSAPQIRVALNREFVEYPWSVEDGDELAFMPPITGG
jgi:molybdopterin synthase sulfur carrier subunit